MNIAEIIVDLPPLSINKAWQGRRYKTKEYVNWLKDGLLLLPKRAMITEPVEVCLTFYMRHVNQADVDNPVKTCLDLMVKRGYLKDDVQVQSLHVYKEKAETEGIKIEIRELQ